MNNGFPSDNAQFNQTPFMGQGPNVNAERYINPFYGIARQYIPLNLDGMLWWADVFLIRFGFYRSALSRIANYFITSLSIDCEDDADKEIYEQAFEDINWREQLGEFGLNLLAYSNAFVSVTPGFKRFLVCPKCGKVTSIDRVHNFGFNRNKYTYTCPNPRCNFSGIHEINDKVTHDPKALRIQHWNPREIKVRYENTTGDSEFYWDMPASYKNKVSKKDNKFFAKKTPAAIYEAIEAKRLLAFNPANFIHVKLPCPAAFNTDGRAVPLAMYMFDDFWILKVLQRFNEAICYEDINPFRVIAMAPDAGNPSANPILTQNGGLWQAAVDEMIEQHRLDPGAYHKFPFPLQYQQMGGEGKALAPNDLMNSAIQNILNALNIPQELYTMNFQINAVGPALRLFENSWSVIPASFDKLLQHIADVVRKNKGLSKATVKLMKITLADDMEKKSVIAQLTASNSIARSELLGLYGFNYADQLRKKVKEDEEAQDVQDEAQEAQQIKQMSSASLFNQSQGQPGGSTPQDVQSQAQEIAQQLFPLDGAGRREKLQEIKGTNATLYAAVKQELQSMTQQSASQGVQGAKQQAAQGPQQGGQ